jgi:phospholipase/lecithinase/hemolysin
MTPHFFTRCAALGLLVLSALLASCGASSIKDPFRPTRIVVFGDALSDNTSSAQYTVNDGLVNNWAKQIAAIYGVTNIVSYAKGNARIVNPIGAAGVAVTSITAQTQTVGLTFLPGDLVVINAGFSDVIAEAAATSSIATANTAAAAAGAAYANLIRTMVAAGAQHIAVGNLYDLSKTPAATLTPTNTALTNLAVSNATRGVMVQAFNDALKINLGNSALGYIGDNVRLIDIEYYMNLTKVTPTIYSFVDSTTLACGALAVDAGAGIGIGTGQVNASLCTPTTLNAAATATTYSANLYDNYVFADAVYPTPAFHRALGNYAYSLLIARW